MRATITLSVLSGRLLSMPVWIAVRRGATLRAPENRGLSMASYEKILFEQRGRVGVITINRPERMNAIDPQTSAELLAAWSEVRDNDDIWAAVLTGAGDRAFSAGNDLVAMSAAQQ